MGQFNTDKAIFAAITGTVANQPKLTTIDYANPLAKSIVGPDIIGMRVVDLFSALLGSADRGEEACETWVEEGKVQFESMFGDYYLYLNSIIDLKNRHFQASLFDISARQRAQQVFEYTAASLARAAEVYDDDTGDHINRINLLSGALAGMAGMDAEFIKNISFYAQLHDVGKIHVDPSIIRKPGRLTDAEFEEIKNHTIYGARIIGDHPALEMSRRIALAHHERWDGNGYPYGLAGDAIPIEARIVTIVDVFDALMSPRPYKKAFPKEQVLEIFERGDERLDPCRHFDPHLRELFLANFERFVTIYNDTAATDAIAAPPVLLPFRDESRQPVM